MRKTLVAANWKMNGRVDMTFSLVEPLASQPIDDIDIIIFPPAPYLLPAVSVLQGTQVEVGGQNLSQETDGAFTGDVSGEMLGDCGATHVLVGHSERRAMYGDTDAVVAAKFLRAQQAGLTPVLCVGESQAQREAGQTEEWVASQLDAVLEVVGIDGFRRAIIAYEPIWAIGTGLTATPEQAQQVHAFIRQKLAKLDKNCADSIRLLYGGSVKADNAASLFSQADIDGGLVGGASLKADSFRAICQAAT